MQEGILKKKIEKKKQKGSCFATKSRGYSDKEEEPWRLSQCMCLDPGCRKMSSCESGCLTESWPPHFLSTLPVFVASLRPQCTQEVSLAEQLLAPTPPLGLFLRLLLSHPSPEASEGSCKVLTCLFPIQVFETFMCLLPIQALRALTVFVFLEPGTFSLQIVLAAWNSKNHEKQLAANACGVGEHSPADLFFS